MIADFLQTQRPDGPFLLCALTDKGKFPGQRFTDAKAAESWALEQNRAKRNVYFVPNEVQSGINKKPTRNEIARVQWLFVDIDQAPQTEWAEDHARIKKLTTEGLDRFGIPKPTLIVDSGGGWQLMWKITTPIDLSGDPTKAEEIERINKALAALLDGDKCHSIDHVYRLPGTINYASPEKLKKQKGRPAEREAEVWSWTREPNGALRAYSLTDFAPLITKRIASPNPTMRSTTGTVSPRPAMGDGTDADESWIPGTASPFGTEELKVWAIERGKWHTEEDKPTPSGMIGLRLLAVMAQGADPLDATKYQSRSEAQWFVSCELVRAGVPDELHYRILTTPGSGVAESVLDKTGDIHGYALKQIRDARKEAEREWWRSADAAMNYLNNKHAVIADMGGKCRIVTEVRDPALNRTRISKQSFEDFHNRYRHYGVLLGHTDDGKPVIKPAGKLWLDHFDRRQYETITFAPGREVEDAYNLWRGFAVESREGDRHKSFLAHISANVCAGNAEHFDYLIGWMARAVQEPDSPGEVAVIMRGGRGTGKSFFAKMFGRLFGRHFLQVADSKHLTGSFNAHLRDTVLLFGDEAFYAGDKKHESILKTLVTEEHLVIEGKGVDAEPGTNYVHLILASNEDWVVPAGLDERRFFALDMADDHKQDHAYFRQIKEDLYQGGFENLLHFLQTYDLSNFEVRRAPDTKTLRSQKAESLQGFDAYLYELLWSGELPKVGRNDCGQWFVPSTALTEAAVMWLKDRQLRTRVSPEKIQKVLGKRLGAEKGRLDNIHGYWWNIAALRVAWDREMFTVDWPPLPEEPPF